MHTSSRGLYARLWITLAALIASGCATTQIVTHTVGARPPLCQAQEPSQTALILWGAAWRENQKEAGLREEMASRAIVNFFKTSPCYSKTDVLKVADGRDAVRLSDVEALKFAASSGSYYDKVVVLRVEELGPIIIIHPSPVLWEGGTEVILRVRALNTNTSALEADISVHWKDSGAFVLKGTKTLEHDLQAALGSIF